MFRPSPSSPPPPPESLEQAIERSRRTVKEIVDEKQEIPGLQHIVIDHKRDDDNDGILVETNHGVADSKEPSRAVDSQTMFMAYSITKIITTIAILQLLEEGKIASLQDPLSSYFTQHPYKDDGVTIQRLLNHTAGIPNPIPTDWFVIDDTEINRDEQLQRILKANSKQTSEPGSKEGYSNIGYWLLEKVLEGVSGESYADYIQKHIFQPLNITDATFDLPHDKMARGHIRKYSILNAVMYLFLTPRSYWIEPSSKWSRFENLHHIGLGYGGLYATAKALASILHDVTKPTSVLLKHAKSRDLLLGVGAMVKSSSLTRENNMTGEVHFSKPGGGIGFHGCIRIYPKLGMSSVYLANSTEVEANPILERANVLDQPFIHWKEGTMSPDKAPIQESSRQQT